MFKTFGFMTKAQRDNDKRVVSAYECIVAAARQPAFYHDAAVADTPLGRFEMISMHMSLLLNAGRNGNDAQAEFLTEVTEEFFRDVDHALRELGIGDTGVPKRIKKLASMFYGRADAMREALDSGDVAALAETLARNIWPEAQEGHQSGADLLARYCIEAYRQLGPQFPEAVLAGTIRFPDAGGSAA